MSASEDAQEKLKRLSLTAAAVKAVAEIVGKQQTEAKAALHDALVATGLDKAGSEAKLPDGTVIGMNTLVAGKKGAVVTDEDALYQWVWENRPEEIVTELRPVTEIRSSYRKCLLDSAKANEDGLAVDPRTGEVIPGIEVRIGESYVATKLAHGAGKMVLGAMRNGAIDPLALPAGTAVEPEPESPE